MSGAPLRWLRAALALGAVALLLGPASPAAAHPYGMPPLAEIAHGGQNVRTTLSLALDDALILLTHVQAPMADPTQAPSDDIAVQPEVAGYITSRYQLAVPEGPCEATVTGGRHMGSGFRIFIDHVCPAPVGVTLTVTNELLRDISPEYRMVVMARAGAARPSWTFEPGTSEIAMDLTPRAADPATEAPAAGTEKTSVIKGLERLFSFLDSGRGWGALVVALGVAMLLGALHGLTPGHGKALVAAYLAGSDAKIRHAFAVGAALTVTHTAAVMAFGIFALVAGKALVPQQVEPILMAVAATLVILLGLWMLVTRVRALRRPVQAHAHHHPPRNAPSGKGLLAVGFAGGIVPCPEAFGLLFVAMSLGRVTTGLMLLVAFSIGLAAVLVAIAVALVLSRKTFTPRLQGSRVLRYLPVVSAVLVTGIGVALGFAASGML